MAEKQNTEKQSAFKELVLPVIVLVVICLVCSALLAVLNDITAPIIAENTQAETLAAYVSVLPEGTTTDSMSARICRFLGDISFPLYVVHYPLMYVFYRYLIKTQTYTFAETWPLALAVTGASICLAWLSLKWYDEPLRKWMKSL